MKYNLKLKTAGIITLAMLGMCQMSSAEALLMNVFTSRNGVDATAYSDWVNAGVTEDIATGAGGTYNAGSSSGATENIDNLTFSSTIAAFNTWYTPTANDMLSGYQYVKNKTATVSIGGFDDGAGNAVAMTSALGDMDGNTFTLEANQAYKLYLFGRGDADGQDTTFTFGGISKTTSPNISTGAEDSHYVVYEFGTGSDLTGFTLDFTYTNNTSDTAAWNGGVLVKIPESQSFALLSGLVIVPSIAIRRRR